MAQQPSSRKERQITRLECPIHGADTGIVSTVQGVAYCQHCRIPASKLAPVEYVPRDLLLLARNELHRACLGLGSTDGFGDTFAKLNEALRS